MIGIYARVSTDDQADKGYSLPDQLRECRIKAGAVDILEYVDDGISGSILDRPMLNKLRDDIREGLITKVVCLDPDRLSRKGSHQLLIADELEKRRAELVFVNGEYSKTAEGRMFFSIRGAISEFEREKIKDRTSRGRRSKARQGKVVKDDKDYGYKKDKEAGILDIYESEAQIVRLIFDLFTDPRGRVKGINGIANYLTESGVPTKRNVGIWHRQVVRQILLNETYTGTKYHNRWNTEGMGVNKHLPKEERVKMTLRPREEWIGVPVPVIIDQEQFDNAQRLLGESRRRWAGTSLNQYLLSGMLRCSDCGNTMTGRKAKNWGTHVFEYSDVKNTAGAKHHGCGTRITCEDIDGYVWDTVVNWLNNADAIESANAETAATTAPFELAEMERIENELKRIKIKRSKLLDFISDDDNTGLVDDSDIREKLKDIKGKEDKLLQRRDELIIEIERYKEIESSANIIKEAAEYYLSLNPEDNPEELTFELKQEILRKVIREIRVNKDAETSEYTVDIFTF